MHRVGERTLRFAEGTLGAIELEQGSSLAEPGLLCRDNQHVLVCFAIRDAPGKERALPRTDPLAALVDETRLDASAMCFCLQGVTSCHGALGAAQADVTSQLELARAAPAKERLLGSRIDRSRRHAFAAYSRRGRLADCHDLGLPLSSASPLDHSVLETDRHRYAVVAPLAEGGMGAIYLGRRVSAGPSSGGHDRQAADVVLKQLLPEHTSDPKLIAMFLREARLTASLDHPNIVRTLDLVNAGEDYFMVMEYVRGGDLRSLLRRAKRRQCKLTVESALHIVSEVLAALEYAHGKKTLDGSSLGLIHRDVSPSNILLGSNGVVKLTDFGIAKAPTQGSVVFKVKGKVGYMAPEQARGEPVDLRTDLFAIGVVLYEVLVGERLFVGNALSPPAVIFAQPIKAPSRKRPEVGAELDAIVLRALSLDPNGRFSSAREFQSAILRVVERSGRRLGTLSLSEDLRRTCGDDSSSWLNLDVPPQATLDGGGTIVESVDGTGVILTDEEDDEFNDRPISIRPHLPPAKELTSVIPVGEDEFDLPATTVAPDPFAKTKLGPPPAMKPPRSAQRHVVREPERAIVPRAAAPTPAPPARRRPLDTQSRAVFALPVPRASPPPPGDESVAIAPASSTFNDVPTRITDSGAHPATGLPARTTPRVERAPAPEPPARVVSAATSPVQASVRAPQPSPRIGRSKAMTALITVILVLLLVALGVGVGALLSGGSPDFSAR